MNKQNDDRNKIKSFFQPPIIPWALSIALENNLNITKKNSTMTNNYIKFIKNFVNIKKIEKEDYFNLFKILLYIEQFERSKMKENILKGCKLRKKRNLYNNDYKFTIFAPTLTGEKPLVKLGDTIILKESLNDYCSYDVKIVDISKKNIDIVFENENFQYNKNKRYNIDLLDSDRPMELCHYALRQSNYYDFTSLIYPEIETDKNYSSLDLNWFNESIRNNNEQKQAVINILNMAALPAPYILFGPPGTGKTATLVELICQAWQKGSSTKVLVCAPSNAAVDEITKRLLKYIPKKFIYRIYSCTYERSKIDSIILPCTYFRNDSDYFINDKILLLKQIILVTTITCGRFIRRLSYNYFSYIIIDEAGQATEPETIIPFLFAKKSDKAQIVLAGDPYQLGPVILSKIAKPLLGISMLKRLMDFCSMYKQNETNNYNPHYVTKLKQNYRSHKCILHVPNQEFYGNELIACGGEKIVNRAIGCSILPNKIFPIIFHSSDGKEKNAKNSYSVYNLEEIYIIMNYLELLLGKWLGSLKVNKNHIGIISPFKQQKIEINKILKKRNWQDINVGTVETFQGREKEIIILTTVRSRLFEHDGIQDIGFLSDEKRFNVALTRAKCLLIVIGNPIVLETNKHWKVLVEYCKENNAFIESPSILNNISVKEKIEDNKNENLLNCKNVS